MSVRFNRLIRDVQKQPHKYSVVDVTALFDGDTSDYANGPILKIEHDILTTGRKILTSINGRSLYAFKTGSSILIKNGTKNALKNITRNKIPKTAAKHIGIEIECMLPYISRKIFLEKIMEQNLGRYITISDDGSITNKQGHLPLELKLLVTENNYKVVVTKVVETLLSCGAKVDNSCGLHVHLDMRLRDAAKCYTALVNKLPDLKKMVASRRLISDYCMENTDSTFALGLLKSRYQMINPHSFSKRKTLEVRMMEGTLDSKRIVNWIDTLIKTVTFKS